MSETLDKPTLSYADQHARAVLPSQLNYHTSKVLAPSYRYKRIALNNYPAGSVAIGATTSTLLEFRLPSTDVYNLGRSYIGYSMHCDADASATNCITTFEDVFDLGSQVSFGAASGLQLCDLQYANNHSKVIRKIDTSQEEVARAGAEATKFATQGLMPSNSTTSTNIIPGGYNKQDGTNGAVEADAPNDIKYDGSVTYQEIKYVAAGDADEAVDCYRRFSLSAFKGTILAVDRDFFSPVEQYLRITSNPGDKIMYRSVAAHYLMPGIAAAASSSVVTNDNTKFNEVFLYLAVEANETAKAALMDSYAKNSLIYQIPYTVGYKNVGGAADGSTNVVVQVSPQYGHRLKRITHSVFNPQEKYNTAYDHANYNGEKIKLYRTALDSNYLQDRQLSCLLPAGTKLNSDDYQKNKVHLGKKSCILSHQMYACNWFHRDQFYAELENEGALPEVNRDEGMLLTIPQNWTFSCDNNKMAGLVHYTWIEYTRTVRITPLGPEFVVV